MKVALLLTLSILSLSAITSLECKFDKYADETGIHNQSPVDVTIRIYDNKDAYAIGNNGKEKVSFHKNKDLMTFTEVTHNGSVNTITTYRKTGKAVYSRNVLLMGKLFPSQHYGECLNNPNDKDISTVDFNQEKELKHLEDSEKHQKEKTENNPYYGILIVFGFLILAYLGITSYTNHQLQKEKSILNKKKPEYKTQFNSNQNLWDQTLLCISSKYELEEFNKTIEFLSYDKEKNIIIIEEKSDIVTLELKSKLIECIYKHYGNDIKIETVQLP